MKLFLAVVLFTFALLALPRCKKGKVLLVGNCKACRTSEASVSAFPGAVVRFNGSMGPRTDVMVWADDLFRSPEGIRAKKRVPRHVLHKLRSEFEPFPSKHSTGFLVWKRYTDEGQDVYCTGFDFGGSVSESTKNYGRKTYNHAWHKERRVAKEDPKWKEWK